MSGLNNILKISIITPSYNQGRFIEATIQSVIGQNYPNLEYIIIDGGSTDNTVDIIKRYENAIAYWVSEKDSGQSHAINKGFARATGDIIAWLNSDDLYIPGTLAYMAQQVQVQASGIFFGSCVHFKESQTGVQSWGSDVVYMHAHATLENVDYIIQPSSFWTRDTWQAVGNLREDMHYAFDWEWFLRAKNQGIVLHSLAKPLSMYRIHDEHKSGVGGNKRQDEIQVIYGMYSPVYATLYKQVRLHTSRQRTFVERVLRYAIRKTQKPANEAEMLKLLEASAYNSYTIAEIQQAISML